MARPKEFDPERALAKAMNLFWRRGYENTSLETLMKEMGIAKQSLYDTFGDKRALYLKAMAHYRDQTNSQMQKMLNLQRDPKDAVVRDFLRDNQARVEAIFLQALARAQKQKEVSPKDDAAALARFFVATIQGMRAMARLKSDRKALEQIARVALAVFNSSNTA